MKYVCIYVSKYILGPDPQGPIWLCSRRDERVREASGVADRVGNAVGRDGSMPQACKGEPEPS